jgi:RHS repeat-associated protein
MEEIESHHLFEGEQRVLLVDDVIRAGGTANPRPDGLSVKAQTLFRYQYSNHLGSACLELDHQAGIISYEEYHRTARARISTARDQSAAETVSVTGMERDEESGLSYHTARYLIGSLSSWSSVDPIGARGGLNMYAYSGGSPIRYVDTSGLADTNWELIQQRALRLEVTATAAGRGIRRATQLSMQALGEQWGWRKTDVGHLERFVTTPAGTTGETFAQPSGENRSEGATQDKAAAAEARAGKFARTDAAIQMSKEQSLSAGREPNRRMFSVNEATAQQAAHTAASSAPSNKPSPTTTTQQPELGLAPKTTPVTLEPRVSARRSSILRRCVSDQRWH